MVDKLKRKLKRKFKRLFTPYNMAIAGSVVLVLISLYVFIAPKGETNKKSVAGESSQYGIRETDGTQMQDRDSVTIVGTKTKEGETISEQDAKKLAIKQFKKLDEKNLKEDDVELIKILRGNEEYFYVASPKNTLEIKLVGGNITRINSIPVENL